MRSTLVPILRSPTGESLELKADQLVTLDGNHVYEMVDGVPILLDEARSIFAGDTFESVAGGRPSLTSLARRRLREWLLTVPVSRRNFENFAQLVTHGAESPTRVLVVGGGILGLGMGALANHPLIDLVETDVYIGPRTAVVCDAHDLPFIDGSFDGVVVQAVLEHVTDPVRVASELHRVLRPGGLLYSEVPFMQQVHEGAYDFTRFTLGGHRGLLRDFAEIDSGAVGGPGEALAWSLSYYARAVIRSPRCASAARATLALLTLPLRWSDRMLSERAEAVDAASGTYVLARRSDAQRSDHEIIAAYDGSAAEPNRRN